MCFRILFPEPYAEGFSCRLQCGCSPPCCCLLRHCVDSLLYLFHSKGWTVLIEKDGEFHNVMSCNLLFVESETCADTVLKLKASADSEYVLRTPTEYPVATMEDLVETELPPTADDAGATTTAGCTSLLPNLLRG